MLPSARQTWGPSRSLLRGAPMLADDDAIRGGQDCMARLAVCRACDLKPTQTGSTSQPDDG